MNSPQSKEQSGEADVNPPPRRKRLRHGWSEASNPHDRIVKILGWITLGLVVVVVAYLVLRGLNASELTP
jgi:hypothetical protein